MTDPSHALTDRNIDFQTPAGPARGYLAMPQDGSTPRPAIIVIHEWWGLNEHTRDLARRFARAGLTALAPDLYDGVVAREPSEAQELMDNLDMHHAVDVCLAAMEAVPQHRPVSEIGVTGFCMGGGIALRVACASPRVGAVATFYGQPPPDDELARLQAPVLFIAAEEDPWINRSVVQGLEDSLIRLRKEHHVEVFPGTKHAFFNDTRPDVHNPEAAARAWSMVVNFFHQELEQEAASRRLLHVEQQEGGGH